MATMSELTAATIHALAERHETGLPVDYRGMPSAMLDGLAAAPRWCGPKRTQRAHAWDRVVTSAWVERDRRLELDVGLPARAW